MVLGTFRLTTEGTIAANARMRYYYPRAPVEFDRTHCNDTASIQPKYARGRFECAEQEPQPQDSTARRGNALQPRRHDAPPLKLL